MHLHARSLLHHKQLEFLELRHRSYQQQEEMP